MAQGVFPFKYESEEKTIGMTARAGLPVYLDLAKVIGLSKSQVLKIVVISILKDGLYGFIFILILTTRNDMQLCR